MKKDCSLSVITDYQGTSDFGPDLLQITYSVICRMELMTWFRIMVRRALFFVSNHMQLVT